MDYEKALEQIKRHEGLKLKPYQCTQGYITIGYGRNLQTKGISEAEAEEMLLNDYSQFEQACHRLGLIDGHSSARQAAIVNIAFNLGVAGLLKFKKALAAYKAQKYDVAAAEFLDSQWAKQVGNRANELAEQIKTGEFIR